MTDDTRIASEGRVVHCKREPFDVYIGRPSKWGNPFVMGKDGRRDQVIEKYEAWLKTQPGLLAALPELRGKVLGCWCAPNACHGDVLLRLSKQLANQAATARHGPPSPGEIAHDNGSSGPEPGWGPEKKRGR